nr:probable sodium/metabolite cotransporter BASS4, chloroplastic [Tanacetum cinerariifolium]
MEGAAWVYCIRACCVCRIQALFGASVFALINPGPGCFAHRYKISTFSTIGIFLITGLTLRNEEIGEAAEAWPVGLFGLVSILLLTPFFSRIMVNIRLQPQEFVTGLALYNCMPTSISSGVSLAKLAGGNSALALAMTVLSNLLGILIVPFSVSKLIRGGVGASVPADKLFKSLIVTVLIPLIMGKVFRDYVKGAADIVDSNRKLFAALGSILLSLIEVSGMLGSSRILHVLFGRFKWSCNPLYTNDFLRIFPTSGMRTRVRVYNVARTSKKLGQLGGAIHEDVLEDEFSKLILDLVNTNCKSEAKG